MYAFAQPPACKVPTTLNATTRRLSGNLLRELAASLPVQRFPVGTTLLTEGDSADFLYVLIEGQLKVYSCNSKGREVVYNILEPGEFFGEMMLDGEPRSASVKAVVDSECVLVPGSELSGMLLAHPEFAECLVLTLISRLRNATSKIRGLALDGVYERVAALLADAAVLDGEVLRVPRAFTQLEIATRVGASREMVNHVLRDLVRGGFILKDKQHRMTIVKKLPQRW